MNEGRLLRIKNERRQGITVYELASGQKESLESIYSLQGNELLDPSLESPQSIIYFETNDQRRLGYIFVPLDVALADAIRELASILEIDSSSINVEAAES